MDAADESRPLAAFLIHASAYSGLALPRAFNLSAGARTQRLYFLWATHQPFAVRFTRAVQGGEFHRRLGWATVVDEFFIGVRKWVRPQVFWMNLTAGREIFRFPIEPFKSGGWCAFFSLKVECQPFWSCVELLIFKGNIARDTFPTFALS